MTSAASYLDGDLYVRLNESVQPSPREFVSVTRMSDDTVLAAIVNTVNQQECYVLGSGGPGGAHAPLLIPMMVNGLLAGHARRDPAPVLWQHHVLDHPMVQEVGFDDFDKSGTWGFAWTDASISTATSLDATQWTIREAGTGAGVFSLTERRGVVVYAWRDVQLGRWVLRGFGLAGGPPRNLVVGTHQIFTVAATDDTMAWFAVDGPHFQDGAFEFVQLYWSPLTNDPARVVITAGPTLPVTSGVHSADAAGDWVATTGCPADGSDCSVIVIRRSTQEVFRLIPPPDRAWVLYALTPDYVLVGDNAKNDPYQGQNFQRITKIYANSYAAWSTPF